MNQETLDLISYDEDDICPNFISPSDGFKVDNLNLLDSNVELISVPNYIRDELDKELQRIGLSKIPKRVARDRLNYKLCQPIIIEGHSPLAHFTKLFWSTIESSSIIWNWHMDVMCQTLERCTYGEPELKRLIINLPPGMTKSIVLTMWSAWEWTFCAHYRILNVSYVPELSIRDNIYLRKIITSPLYRRLFWDRYIIGQTKQGKPKFKKVRLVSKVAAEKKLVNNLGGWSIATSLGGEGTGQHPDRIKGDDLQKAADCYYPNKLDTASKKWRGTFADRIGRNPVIVNNQQRVAENDITGESMKREKWHHLMLQMTYQKEPNLKCGCHKKADSRDPRRENGELMFPQLYSRDRIEKVAVVLGPRIALARFQQDPRSFSGTLFVRTQIVKILRSEFPNEFDWTARCYDTAATKDGGDYTVGTKGSSLGEDLYIQHVVRCQTDEVDELMIDTAKLDGIDVAIREEIDPGTGKNVIHSHEKELKRVLGKDCDYAGHKISGNKVHRSRPVRQAWRQGKIYVAYDDEWGVEAWLDRICSFTGEKIKVKSDEDMAEVGGNDDDDIIEAEFDDDVDSLSCLWNVLMFEDRGGAVEWEATWNYGT